MSKYKVTLHWDEKIAKAKGIKYPGTASLTIVIDAPTEKIAASSAEAMNPGFKKISIGKI
jgi:hypothetical protein